MGKLFWTRQEESWGTLMPGLVGATTQFAEPRHKRHYDMWSQGLTCELCGGARSNKAARLCSDCNNTWWLPKLRKWRAKKRKWLERFAKLQEGKIPPSCPSCGCLMRLWYGWWDIPNSEDVTWVCRHETEGHVCTAELELEKAEDWRLEVALAAAVKRRPKKPVVARPPLVDGIPMVKSVDLTIKLGLGKMTIWTWHNKGHIRGKILPAGGKRALYVCRADVVAHLKKRLKAKRGRPFKKEKAT